MMRDLQKALADISAIRGQMARGTTFRGYGPAALSATGCLALLVAAIQAAWLNDPASDIGSFLGLWIATAGISVVIVGMEAVRRSQRAHSGLADDMLRTAAEEFVPAAMAGVLLTAVIVRFASGSAWMLPGLWQIVFSLGVFASCRSLPRPMITVAVWYLIAGLVSLALASETQSISPWAMGLPFGVGQFLAAFLLWRSFGGGDGES
jgi:hypothetical protein